jgi:glycine/D-amino acid oxidase-like deaminating enzyme
LRLLDETNVDCDLQQGVVVLAKSAANYADLAATVDGRNAFYETQDYMLPADRLDEEAGGRAASEFAGALVMPGAHTVQPAKMMMALAAFARRLGVAICERTEVVDVQAANGGFRVITNGGELVAHEVLRATGGYTRESDRFLWPRTLGLPSIAAATEPLPEDEVRDVCRTQRVLLVNGRRTFTCRPSPDGRRLILGGPVGQNPVTPERDARGLHDYFTKIFPDLAGIEFTHCWSGLIAGTLDGRGHSGAHDGAWYNVGASGLVSSADAGRRVVQHILHADRAAASADKRFPRWPFRASESLLRRGFEWSTRVLDVLGRSRLR